MQSELVTRLREFMPRSIEAPDFLEMCAVTTEAADELERLHKEVERLKSELEEAERLVSVNAVGIGASDCQVWPRREADNQEQQ